VLPALIVTALVSGALLTPHASARPAAAHRSAASKTVRVQVQRAGYVVDTPVDPYAAEAGELHVAVAAGREVARSFLRLAPAALGRQTESSTLRLSLPVVAPAPGLLSGLSLAPPVIEACVLLTTLPTTVTASDAPAVSCARGSAIGVPDPAGTAWSFRLVHLVHYWRTHADTGIALLPISSSPTATWTTSFSVKGIAATVGTLAKAADATRPASSAAAAATTSARSAGTTAHRSTTGAVAPPLVPTAAGSVVLGTRPGTSTAPEVAGATRSVRTDQVADPGSGRSGAAGAWPWVLALCLLIALGAVAVAHRIRIEAELRRVLPPAIAAYRRHPRSYGVATAAVAWGLVFTVYAVTTEPSGSGSAQTVAEQPGVTGGQTPIGAASTAPGTGRSPGGRGTTGGRTTPGIPGTGGGTGPTSGGGHGGGPAPSPTTSEFAGKGTWRTIDGTRVFFPAGGGIPVADLYHGAADRIGISSSSITLCAHAALTYGPAFNIGAKDLNVYWDYLNAHGGIYGRKVTASYVNDNYDPGTAVQAAETCKGRGTFFLIGGIGFDQIPAVRQWAEQNHELYLYHDAVEKGSVGLHYSFTALPSVEALGNMFGQLDLRQFKGKKVGILYRQSPNWEPGSDAFEQVVRAGGGQIVAAYPVQNNQANYVQDLVQLHQHGAQVIFAWENALATVEMLKQAQTLDYHPAWLMFPFNLQTNTLGASAFSQPMYGVATWDAYDPYDLGGPFKPYAASMREFAKEYHAYDPGANLAGDGGDLLYLNWEGQRFIAYLLHRCGPNCTRNKLAGMLLAGFHLSAPPECSVDFNRDDHHHGGYEMNVLRVIKDPRGRPNWAPLARCRTTY
jgi:hypothetical protein